MLGHAASSTVEKPARWSKQAVVAFVLEVSAVFLNLVSLLFAGFTLAFVSIYSAIVGTTTYLNNANLIGDAFSIGTFALALAGIVLSHLSLVQSKKHLKGRGLSVAAMSIGYLHVGVFLLRLLVTTLAIAGDLQH